MITETILNLIVFIILGIIKLFPTFPEMDLDFLNGVIRVLSLVDMFVSVKTLAFCLVVIFLVWNGQLIWSSIMWVVRKIPGIE